MVVVVDMCTVYVGTGMLCGCIVVYGMYMAVYGNVSNVCCLLSPVHSTPPFGPGTQISRVVYYVTHFNASTFSSHEMLAI
jgi:hypothetical protein